MIAKIWRYYFGRSSKEIWFAFLSAAFWTVVLQLLNYAEGEWLVVVTLGYIGGMVSRFLLGNIVFSIIESRLEYMRSVQKEWEEALLAQRPQYRVEMMVYRAIGVVAGVVIAFGSVAGLAIILTDVFLLMLQLPSLGATLVFWVRVCFVVCTTLYALFAVLIYISAGEAGKQERGKVRQRLWGHTMQSNIGRFAVGI